ncbi:type III PLP-dependent enzyme domain-containing protein [Streptomyces microflavus]|uniref:type III PLP-dependent enzyme n=1 Tax=Streptomyces microflavus TaxID=1919 RepID=UPI00382DAEA1
MTLSLADLVAAYGSPLYVYELSDSVSSVRRLRAALPEGATLYYSLKANPHPVLAGELGAAGCAAEISSTGELDAALQAGFPAERCLYTGPGKVPGEIEAAVRAGVRRFSVESARDYRAVARSAAACGAFVQCLVRINAPRPHGSASVRMTGTASPFGVPSAHVIARPEDFAPQEGCAVAGFHFFSMSNARTAEDLRAALSASLTEARTLADATGLPLDVLDLGGGFAAPYAAPGTLPHYGGLREALEEELDTHVPGWRDGSPEIAFESGRYVAATSGRLVCTATDVKRDGDRTFVVLDAGIHHLGGLSGLGRTLPMTAHPLSRAASDASYEGEPVTLVGPLCTPADVLARAATVGPVAAGDLLVFPNVGAYGLTGGLLGFLSRPVAGEVVLRDGVPVHASRIELRRTPYGPRVAGAA